MHQVKVRRDVLIGRILTNRDAHREQFLTAQQGFRARVIEELDEMLADARAGKHIRTQVRLRAPEDHTVEYDRVLDMLELSEDSEIVLNAATFAQVVRNEWAWFERASTVNATYSLGGKVDLP